MRESTARVFERWGAFVARNPWPVLIVTLAAVAWLAGGLPRIVLDTTTEGFLHKDDPTLVVYDDFRARFGRDDSIVIGIESSNLYTHTFLERLRDLHDEVEAKIPHLDEVTSMINARWTRGEEDQLLVEDLVEEWPETDADLADLKARVAANPLYENLLVSADGRLTTMQIDLDTYVQDGVDEAGQPISRYLDSDEIRAVTTGLFEIAERHETEDFTLHIAGVTLLPDRIGYYLVNDLGKLVRIALLMIGLILFVLFGKLKAAVLPLLIVALTVASTLGLLPLLGMAYQMPTQILPISLLAIGVSDSVHILAIYYQRRRSGDDRPEAIAAAFEHSGISVLMTSVTTAAALMSFLSADLAPIANLGVLAPTGVMIAFLLTMTLLPALLAILPEREASIAQPRFAFLDRFIVRTGVWATRQPWSVVAGAAVLTAVALAGVVQVRFSHNPMVWFPESNSFRLATEHMNERLGGVLTVEALFDTGSEGGGQNPEFLAALDRITVLNAAFPRPEDGIGEVRDSMGTELRVAKTVSMADLLKEINRALNENRQEEYKLPTTRELAAQELLLFEISGSDDLEDLADYGYRTARMTMRVPWLDALLYGEFIDALSAAQRREVGDDVDVQITGRLPLLTRTFNAVVFSMARSYVIAFAAIVPLMIFILGRFSLGMLAMIPNVLPIVAMLGLMGWLDLPLDAFSLLSGSIALGLAVDDTIHFMNGYSRNLARSGDTEDAVRETLETTGQALVTTSLVLCSGFLVFTAAYMTNSATFGFVTAFALAVALIADVVLAPALVALASRRRTAVSEPAPTLP